MYQQFEQSQMMYEEDARESFSATSEESSCTSGICATELSDLTSLESTIKNLNDKFRQMDEDLLLQEYQKCSKSNVTKNILYQFKYFIEETGDQIVLESISQDRTLAQIRKEFHNFSRKKKLNQSFMVSILKSKRFNIQFAYFLSYYTEEWILTGNIKNISDHLLCIIFLLRCHDDQNLINQIITYKKKN